MRNWQGLVIGFLAVILASVSAGVSMTKAPDANTIAVICQIEGRDLAPEFADAICLKLIEALSELMPEQTVVERNDETANIRCVIGFDAAIVSEYFVKGELSWANLDDWNAGKRSSNGQLDFSISDKKLNGSLAGHFVAGHLRNFDPLSIC